jgi:hypothetical protein
MKWCTQPLITSVWLSKVSHEVPAVGDDKLLHFPTSLWLAHARELMQSHKVLKASYGSGGVHKGLI